MSTAHIFSKVSRLVVGAAVIMSAAGCGGEMLRTGRSPVYLTVDSVTTTNGASNESGTLLRSDVITLVKKTVNGQEVRIPTIFDDIAEVLLRVTPKNETVVTTALNAVTIDRYRINFRRADGRGTPGVDVPYGWDGATSLTIQAGGTGSVSFELVRHVSKEEPPLKTLAGNGGQQYIYTIAEITFFGHDQNGNEVTATAFVDVAFSDFGDPDS